MFCGRREKVLKEKAVRSLRREAVGICSLLKIPFHGGDSAVEQFSCFVGGFISRENVSAVLTLRRVEKVVYPTRIVVSYAGWVGIQPVNGVVARRVLAGFACLRVRHV